MCAAPYGEQPVARGSRLRLYPAFRLPVQPSEHLVADTSCRQPDGKAPDFRATLGPQAVIDGQRANLAAVLTRPTIGENGKRQAVGSAGNGDSEERRVLEACERSQGCRELGKVQRIGRGCAGQQPSRFFSAAARSLSALPACGKSRSSSAKAMQAFCF